MRKFYDTIILGLLIIAVLPLTGCFVSNTAHMVGNFPRPAYDSGWFPNYGTYWWLYHNVGGNPDNYVIDFQFRDNFTDENGERVQWISNRFYGGAMSPENFYGAYYEALDSVKMSIRGGHFSSAQPSEIRVRIWVLEPIPRFSLSKEKVLPHLPSKTSTIPSAPYPCTLPEQFCK